MTEPLAPVQLPLAEGAHFSAPRLLFGVVVPAGQRIRVAGSVSNDGDYTVLATDGAEGIDLAPNVTDEPAGRAPFTVHWLPEA